MQLCDDSFYERLIVWFGKEDYNQRKINKWKGNRMNQDFPVRRVRDVGFEPGRISATNLINQIKPTHPNPNLQVHDACKCGWE